RRSSGLASRICDNCPWPTMRCISLPIPESESNSCTSISLQVLPLISYSLAPSRNMRLVIDTSVYSIGNAPSELSIVNVTSARPSADRPDVPAKMTSSILPPRRSFAPCVPITQRSASNTFDLPVPFGPTTQVIPGSKRSVVAEAKDLKPFIVRLFRCTWPLLPCRLPRRTCLPVGRYYPAARRDRRTWGRHRGEVETGVTAPRSLPSHRVPSTSVSSPDRHGRVTLPSSAPSGGARTVRAGPRQRLRLCRPSGCSRYPPSRVRAPCYAPTSENLRPAHIRAPTLSAVRSPLNLPQAS